MSLPGPAHSVWRALLGRTTARIVSSTSVLEGSLGASDLQPSGIWQRLRRLAGPGPLEWRLFWIVFAGLLPLTLLAFATLLQTAERQKLQQIKVAEDVVRTIVASIDADLNTSRALLDVLAASPRLAANDIAGFHQEALAILPRVPAWGNVLLSDATSKQLMNARLPFGSPLSADVDGAAITEAARTGNVVISNLMHRPTLKQHAFAIHVPVSAGAPSSRVLTAVILPTSVRELLQAHLIPPEGVVVVLDRAASVVTRSLNHDEWIGKKPSPTLLKVLDGGRAGDWLQTNTLEGIPVYTIYQRSAATGWTTAIGVPMATLDAPVVRSYLILGASILGSIALGVLAAYLTARTITRPMRELAAAANAVGRGEPPHLPSTRLPEVRQAAAALSLAHVEREQLLQRERDARHAAEHARSAAEQASKTKDEFLAMLGHELRNPLAAISTASQVLEHASPTASSIEMQARSIIRRQATHLARLTDDLLDAGRLIMGKIALDRRPVNLSEVVRAAVETLSSTGKLDNHQFTSELTTAWVDADPTRLDQIVANLLTNAIKYTPAGGSINVRVITTDDVARMIVTDSGLGLEPDLLPRVFDLFVQGQRSLDRSQGGLGIGLTLVRRLAELHGGHVEAHSRGSGLGSEFIVCLPRIEAPPVVAVPARTNNARVCRIAVIEDNADVRAGIVALLELEGHEVFEAADGEAGVELVLHQEVDVALIDVGLPELDGYGVARALRARCAYRPFLIAVTGYGNRDDIDRGSRAGFDAYLVKPVDPEKLQTAIANSR